MADRKTLTQKRVRELLEYNPDTGIFIWRRRVNPRAAAGDIAGTSAGGRWGIRIDGVRYLAHRLAWLYMHGRWPESEIDHINRNPLDNRLANLRVATRSQNLFNRANVPSHPPNGIDLYKRTSKWRVRIKVNGEQHHLGYFENMEDALKKRLEAEQKHYPGFARYAGG